MKHVFTLLALLMITTARAHADAPSCLKSVSDQDLLDEVSFRMGRTTPNPSASALASFSCRFQTLTVSLVDATSGNEQKEEMQVTDPSACSVLETTLSSKIGNRALTKAAIVAGCRFQTLLRVSLSPTAQLKKLQDQTLTDPSACNAARDRINDAL